MGRFVIHFDKSEGGDRPFIIVEESTGEQIASFETLGAATAFCGLPPERQAEIVEAQGRKVDKPLRAHYGISMN